VDIVMDVANRMVHSVDRMARSVVKVGPVGNNAKPTTAASGFPTVSLPKGVKAGERGDTVFQVENEGVNPLTGSVSVAGGLTGGNGQTLPAECVRFEPATFRVEPHSNLAVKIEVQIPAGTPPGVYCGLVQSGEIEALKFILAVPVD
jgi:hypothetical protein